MKTVIFGNSGSGKSTLAKRLATRKNSAHLDLDTLAWESERPTERKNLEASLDLLQAFIVANASWVIEGSYGSLLEPATRSADEVIFLNPGADVCRLNCLSRPWEGHKYPSKAEQDANLSLLLDWISEYETRKDEFSLAAHKKILDGFRGTKSELTSNDMTALAAEGLPVEKLPLPEVGNG